MEAEDRAADAARVRQAGRACRAIYVGTDSVIAGLNSLSGATADAGMARGRHGIAMLGRIGRDVKREAGPRRAPLRLVQRSRGRGVPRGSHGHIRLAACRPAVRT
jgi:hypothetical protein